MHEKERKYLAFSFREKKAPKEYAKASGSCEKLQPIG